MPPPISPPVQSKDKGPLVPSRPKSKPIHSTTMRNKMNASILPVVAIVTVAVVTVAICAMVTDTPLALKASEYLDLRIGLDDDEDPPNQ